MEFPVSQHDGSGSRYGVCTGWLDSLTRNIQTDAGPDGSIIEELRKLSLQDRLMELKVLWYLDLTLYSLSTYLAWAVYRKFQCWNVPLHWFNLMLALHGHFVFEKLKVIELCPTLIKPEVHYWSLSSDEYSFRNLLLWCLRTAHFSRFSNQNFVHISHITSAC